MGQINFVPREPLLVMKQRCYDIIIKYAIDGHNFYLNTTLRKNENKPINPVMNGLPYFSWNSSALIE